MLPGGDPMGAPTSLTARRPHASNLPSFELPPPPLSSYQQQHNKYGYAPNSQPTATTLTSVGNLLTPPSNGSADGLSPTSSGVTSSHHGSVAYPPNSGAMWPTSTSAASNAPYGFHTSAATPQYAARGLFSPSLNSLVRGNNSPTASEGLPPPNYEMSHYTTSSMSMSTPNLPAASHQQQQHHHHMMMGANTPSSVAQPSPVHSQDPFSRPPPTPTYYAGAHSSSAPQQSNYTYATGPSHVPQSPLSAGVPKMSPVSAPGFSGVQQAAPYSQRYSYPLPGPVLSNVNNPGGQMSLVGGVPHGMMNGYNSGHAAHVQHMYGHAPQANTQNERPFRCDQCPQSFNRNHDLKRHKRIHLAVKPFPCGHCDKSFSRKDALKRHILVKGCGKAGAGADIKELDGSVSPLSQDDEKDGSILSAS